MTNLQKRILAAAIYFPFLLLCSWDVLSFSLVLLFCLATAWYEYLRFWPENLEVRFKWNYVLWIFAGSLPILFLCLGLSLGQAFLWLGILWQIALIVALYKKRTLAELLAEAQFYIFGFLYITGLYTCLAVLHRQPGGREAIWFLLFVVGASDTGAYFIGRHFGKESFFAHVSPKKTREGFWGGLISGILVALLVASLLRAFDFSAPVYWKAAALGVIVSVFSSFGDLVESLIKRNFGVKDSGKIIAGHGGVLDRFDGVIFAALPLLLFVVMSKGFF